MHAVPSRQPDRRGLAFAAALLLLLASMWQLGGGLTIRAKAILAQILVRDAWERTLKGERQAKPWPWADTWPVARLSVPEQRIDLFVLAGANGRTIAFGPGHVFGTAPPGEEGNSVIGGHRDTHLAFLRDTKPGMELRVQRPDRRASRWSPATRSTRCARAGRSGMWCLRTRSKR
jgi:sortase A